MTFLAWIADLAAAVEEKNDDHVADGRAAARDAVTEARDAILARLAFRDGLVAESQALLVAIEAARKLGVYP